MLEDGEGCAGLGEIFFVIYDLRIRVFSGSVT